MKSFVALFLSLVAILAAIIAVDHFDLLKTNDRYPPAVNRIIVSLQQEDFRLPKPDAVKAPVHSAPPEILNKTLYRWKNTEGVWEIGDAAPENTLYETFTLTTDSIASPGKAPADSGIDPPGAAASNHQTPSEAELKREAQCRYYLEQIDNYRNKMRFGAPSETMTHWQKAADYYRRLAMSTCASFEPAG